MMKQTIGFDRELHLSWLDLTAGLAQENLDVQRIRQELLTRLADEIPGQKACKNTITVLTRIWIRVPSEYQALRTEALTLVSRILPEERLWLHWGMSMLAYPFFYDVAGVVGQLLNLQEVFEPSQVHRRMRESWGQRTTLYRAINRVIQTLLTWDVIQPIPAEQRTYQASPRRQTTNSALTLWFIECLLQSTRQAVGQNDRQIPLTDLIQAPAAFPFDLTPHIAALRRSNRFLVNRQGLDLEMVALG